MQALLVAVAVLFAFVNGLNDGGALLSVSRDVRTFRPLTGLVMLTAAVAVTPLLVGTEVATTLVDRLVVLDGTQGQLVMLVAVVVAVAVSYILAWRGLPTSLTLALVGAIAGAGIGASADVAYGTVAVVLVLALAAPVIGAIGALGLLLLAAQARGRTPVGARVRRWHVFGFVLQCVAYGANDAQKMLAVIAVAVGASAGGVGGGASIEAVPWQLAVVAVAFLAGAAVGLPRFGGTVGGGLTRIHPSDTVITEISAGAVVLATGAAGSPVSMTQAVSGALVGIGATRGTGRVRWRQALRIVGAWALTLPVAVATSMVCSAVVSAAVAV